MMLSQFDIHTETKQKKEEEEVVSPTSPIQENQFQVDCEPNQESLSPKISLGDKIREYILNHRWKSFMNKCKIIPIIKEKSDKFDYIAMKKFCSSKESIQNRMKRQTTGQNIFATYITDKRLVSKKNSKSKEKSQWRNIS